MKQFSICIKYNSLTLEYVIHKIMNIIYFDIYSILMIKFIALVIVIASMIGTLFIISTTTLPVAFDTNHASSTSSKQFILSSNSSDNLLSNTPSLNSIDEKIYRLHQLHQQIHQLHQLHQQIHQQLNLQ